MSGEPSLENTARMDYLGVEWLSHKECEWSFYKEMTNCFSKSLLIMYMLNSSM